MKAVILSRVSSITQENEGVSLEGQERRLKEYCQKKGFDVLKVFRFSESSTVGKRAKFYEMIDYVERREGLIHVVCDTVDRFQRSYKETLVADKLRAAEKIHLHFIRENMQIHKDSCSDVIFQWDLFVALAKKHTNRLSEDALKSIDQKIEQAELPGLAPIGYLNVKDPETKRSNVILDDTRKDLVKKIFADYATGLYSLREIASRAKNRGLLSRKRTPLSVSSIQSLLQNSFYCGTASYSGVRYQHKYPSLISKNLFDQCQNIMVGKTSLKSKKTKTPFIFRGLISCIKCNCAVSPEIKKGKYIYLRPSKSKGPCDCRTLREIDVLHIVRDRLTRLGISKERYQEIKESLKASLIEKAEGQKTELRSLRSQFELNKKKLDRLLDMRIEEEVSRDEYLSRSRQIKEEQDHLFFNISRHSNQEERFACNIDLALKFAMNAVDIFDSSEIDEKRQIINFAFSNLLLEGKNLIVSMRKPFNILLDINDCPVWLASTDKFRKTCYEDVILLDKYILTELKSRILKAWHK